MRLSGSRAGASLADLIITLALMAIIAAIAAPRAMRARDVYAVRAARDAVAAELDRARALAAARGDARLIVDAAAALVSLEAPAGIAAGQPLRVGDAFAVTLSVDGHTTGAVTLDFNAGGLGVSANRTLRFRRGDAEARLSLSLYGRARRW